MVRIRLRRTGAKKQPHYRVVVADARSPRDGKFIETIGYYNPRTEPPTIEIDAERALHWLSVGAQPSEAVGRMLDKLGIMAQAAATKVGEVPLKAVEALPVPVEMEGEPLEGVFEPLEAEAEALAEEEEEISADEDEEFEDDSLDEDEDLDELDDWEEEGSESDESDDFEEDWDLDVEEDDDFDDDEFDEDDE